MICPASAGTLHRRLSPCHKAPPPPPDLGQMQGAEPIASPEVLLRWLQTPSALHHLPSTLFKSLKISPCPNLLDGGIFPKPLQQRGYGQVLGMPQCLWCPSSPAHPLCPRSGWAAPLQWVLRQIHAVVTQGDGEPRARLSQGEQRNETGVISRLPSELQPQESWLGALASTSFKACGGKQGVSPFCGSAQPAAGCRPSQPWHLPHPRIGRAKPLLEGQGGTDRWSLAGID